MNQHWLLEYAPKSKDFLRLFSNLQVKRDQHTICKMSEFALEVSFYTYEIAWLAHGSQGKQVSFRFQLK